jgi:hypothetical protein
VKLKARMKVVRYKASGITQRRGAGARSVVICIVMASSRLDPTADRATQRSFRRAVTGAARAAASRSERASPLTAALSARRLPREARSAAPNVSTAKMP